MYLCGSCSAPGYSTVLFVVQSTYSTAAIVGNVISVYPMLIFLFAVGLGDSRQEDTLVGAPSL